MRTLRFLYLLSILSAAMIAPDRAECASRQRIAAFNVSLQPVFTIASAAVQGNLRTRHDWARCLRSGAVAGLGFYEAKRLAGNGHTLQALAVANVASSLTRNAAAGRPALARLGIAVGPAWVDVSTPLDKNRVAPIHLQVSASEMVALALTWRQNDRIVLRDGLVSFRKTGRYNYDDRNFAGYTIGVFSGTTLDATQKTWHHETIHVIQSIQADSVEPPACAWLRRPCKASRRRLGFMTWEPLQLGIVPASGGGILSQQDYTKRCPEIEATWLAERHAPK
jgi:hypothetical protein